MTSSGPLGEVPHCRPASPHTAPEHRAADRWRACASHKIPTSAGFYCTQDDGREFSFHGRQKFIPKLRRVRRGLRPPPARHLRRLVRMASHRRELTPSDTITGRRSTLSSCSPCSGLLCLRSSCHQPSKRFRRFASITMLQFSPHPNPLMFSALCGNRSDTSTFFFPWVIPAPNFLPS